MAVDVRVGVEAGRPVVVKVADAGADADRLAGEALVLRLAVHPGVVEVVRVGELEGGGFELVTAHAGSATLASTPLDLEAAADVVASLAATVADLHALGVVHGRIRPDHVVLHASGRPVLCGFGGAGQAGAVVAGQTLSPADDVAGLGDVLAGLVGGPEGDGDWEPIPRRRLGPRGRWHGFVRRSLLNLADQARADDPAARPTARAFAEAVVQAVPRRNGGDDGSGRRRAGRMVAAAVGLGLVTFGAASVLGSAPSTSPSAAPRSTVLRPGLVASTGDTTPATVAEATTSTTADVRIDGTTVDVAGVRYSVGEAGDHLSVGDWDCDGTTTVAAVRSSTGEIFLFGAWASPGAPVEVTPAAVVPGAVDVRPAPGCGGLEAVLADGSTVDAELLGG